MFIWMVIFLEYGLLSKIVSDVGSNISSEILETFTGVSAYITQCPHHATIKAMDK